jgi:predicted phage terminase large subunit-like protein
MSFGKGVVNEAAALSATLRQLIEDRCSGFDSSAGASAQRKRKARNDLGYFAREYFPHYVDGSTSILHEYLFKRLPKLLETKGQKLALAAPRGEAKSTICSQIFVLWCVVHDLCHYVPIIQDAFEQAEGMLEAIKAELDTNTRLKADYPKAWGVGRVWNAGVAITANDVKLQALGSGKRLRGLRHGPYRPDLVVLDDIENDENVQSPDQRDKLERWLNKAVLKLGPPDGSLTVLYIGTILHYDSVLARTLKRATWECKTFKAIIEYPHRMDLWDTWGELIHNEGFEAADTFYRQRKKEMNAGAVVSWPDKRPLHKLMFARYEDRNAFDSEYQNDPISNEDAPFANISMWIKDDPDWIFFGAVDPSMGKTGKGRDPSAILVGGFNRTTGVLDVVEAKIAKRLPDRIIEDVIALQEKYHCLSWAVEAVQFQAFLLTELTKRGSMRGVPIPAVPVVPNRDKQLRIEALQPYVLGGKIRLHPSQSVLLQQLRHWPKGDHDDGPDCLEMLWNAANKLCVDYSFEPVGKQSRFRGRKGIF